ncbi:MAG TPA: oligosaccharide flippase family protein [Solirubrobacteraceae bacterium]|jgi:O-antigen/teichoic acid export membrane protein|nr:oligosaccharide flippase family protein [Solirubrobacteraceae bacterium]
MSDEPQSKSDIRDATLRGLRWIVVARPVVEVMLIGSMVVLARLIPPAEFGHFAVATLISGLGVVSAAAVTTALTQRPELTRAHQQAGVALALLGGAVLFVLTLIAADTIVTPAFGARTAYLVRISSAGTLIAAFGAVPMATLQRRLEFRRLSVIDVASSAWRAFGSVGLALAGLSGTAMVIGVVGGVAVSTALSCVWAHPPMPRLSRKPVREVLDYGMPAWMAAVSWIGFQNCDYAIVGARLGAVQAGYYFRAYTLGVEYQKKVSQVMATVGFPVLARSRSNAEMSELRAHMVRLLTVWLFPLLALLAIVAPVAVPWLFGAEWGPAVAPTQVLVIGGAATLVIDAVGAALMAEGRARALLGFGWAHFATYGAAVFVTAPLGLTAVATSAAVVHSAFVIVAYALMARTGGLEVIRRLWADIAPAMVSCAALVAAALPTSMAMTAVHAPAFLDLAAVTLAAATGYLAVLRLRFPAMWASTVALVGHLLPQRARRRQAATATHELAVPGSVETYADPAALVSAER